jgi:hypothetical protein
MRIYLCRTLKKHHDFWWRFTVVSATSDRKARRTLRERLNITRLPIGTRLWRIR